MELRHLVLGTIRNGNPRNIALASLRFLRENFKERKKWPMRGTRHNGKSGKNGVYDPKHNDRRFNVENSDHIHQKEVWKNIYWDYF